MKKLFVLFSFLTILACGHTQENPFLKRSYWKQQPSISTIQKEMSKGSDISTLDRNSFDPVVWAILENNPDETIQFLVEQKGNGVNKRTHDGRTYIFWAGYKNRLPLMEFLVSKGAKTDLIDSKGYSLVNFMASTGQINQKLYEFCLKYAPDFSSDLTKNKANPALLIAPYLKDTSLLSFFSKNKASISALDNQGNNAFVYAARTGNIQIMEWLISQNIGPNKQSGNAMIFAAQGTRSSKNNIEVFKFLIKNGVALDYQNEQGTAFHFVSTYGNQELIQFFLTNGANINQANKKGVTPFMQSMNNSSLEVLKLMLEHKPLIDQKDQDGNNVLSYLIKGFHKKDSILFNNKIALLKTAQLDVSTTQKDGNNLFHLAVEKNSNYLVRLANQYQLAINVANKNGLTPLHLACNLSDDIDLIQLLISFKSDTQIKTSFGETAFELANENELLKEQNLEFLK